jgi:protein TonB
VASLKFSEYLAKTLRYPAEAKEASITGKVFLTFVIEKNGGLTDIRVLRGLGSGCDEEAIRVLKASPKWIPGQQNGEVVREQFTLPVSFRVNDMPSKATPFLLRHKIFFACS